MKTSPSSSSSADHDFKEWLKNTWKRLLIIVLCLGLLIARWMWPKMQLDVLSISLIAVAVLTFFMPEPEVLLQNLKRVRIWEAEVELRDNVKDIGKGVEAALDFVSAVSNKSELPSSALADIDEILREAEKEPRIALLRLLIKIENHVTRRLQEAGFPEIANYPLSKAIQAGVSNSIFPHQILTLMPKFLKVRNKIIHDASYGVEEATVLTLITEGIEILILISTDYYLQKGSNQIKSNP